MPVRIVGEDGARSDVTEQDAGGRRRGSMKWALLGIAVLLLGAVGVMAVWGGSANHPVPNPSATPPISTTGEVDGVPGLWRGTATVSSGNTSTVLQLRTGWPQTVDGAVAAAVNDSAVMVSLDNLRPSTAAVLDKQTLSAHAYPTLKSPPELWEQAKAFWHLDDEGRPLGPDGRTDPALEFYLAGPGLERYSAYQVTEVAPDLTEVKVRVWMPAVDGTGSVDDVSQVRVQWKIHALTMVWENDDWRMDAIVNEENVPQLPIHATNASAAMVREALGAGWTVPADWTDQPYPGAVITQ